MRPAARGVVLSGHDTDAIIGLLRLIAAWLETSGPAVRDDLQAHLHSTSTGLRPPGRHPADLPGQIARATAMLAYRQMTGGIR